MKIVLTGGGTAGHVIPHLAVLPYLRESFSEIHYIGSHNGIEKNIISAQAAGVVYHSVTTVKLRRSIDLRNLLIPFKLLRGIGEAKKVLKTLEPDIVFSKGGFVAYPVVRAAAKLGIPVIAHESDMTMGLANRLSAKHCRVICTTFKKTAAASFKKTNNGRQPRFIHTGSPIRQVIFNGIGVKVQRRHGFSQLGKTDDETKGQSEADRPVSKGNLLVIGGSLGATKINEAVRAALGGLLKNYNIVHICGKGKVTAQPSGNEQISGTNQTQPLSGVNNGGYVQLEFADDIQNYFAWADVVVSRAGSNALCELLALGKPTLFIPLATGRGDQIENAGEVLKTNAAAVLWEQDLTSQRLTKQVNEVYKNSSKYSKNAVKMGDSNGAKRIAGVIVDTVKLEKHKKIT